jgi:hypothetical protein
MWFPYLPKEYLKFIEKVYKPIQDRIEDRLFYFYTRNKAYLETKKEEVLKKEKKPIVIDEVKSKILFEPLNKEGISDLVLVHPNWNENYKKFLKPIETIDIPYLVNSKLLPYTYPFVYLNEYATHIDIDNLFKFFKGDINSTIESILSLLEQKGTFIVITGEYSSEIMEILRGVALQNGILYGEWEIGRERVEINE